MSATTALFPVGVRHASEGLRRLMHTLDGCEGVIPLQNLIEELQQSDLFARDMGGYAIYREDRYARNLIRGTPFYELYCMCWRSGQCSTIHDHGESQCAVRVLQGIMTNTDFVCLRPGLASPTESTLLLPGSTHGNSESDIHQIGNLQPSLDLMTLHIYSPPLRQIKTFRRG